MKAIYFFIDGIAFGENNPDRNPFTRYANSVLSPLGGELKEYPRSDHVFYTRTDASLGIPGEPQSATGQTSLWTGINGPKVMGFHMTAMPGVTLSRVIHEYSIIKVFRDHGKSAMFLNAYSREYLEKLALNPRFISASTHTQLASGIPPLTLEDMEKDQALYMDITNMVLQRLSPQNKERFPVEDPRSQGRKLVRMSRNYDLALFEYFLSDKAGHEQNWEMSKYIINVLEEFILGIMDEMDQDNELLVVTSDHGNMEDLGVKTHTGHEVPTISYGKHADLFAEKVKKLTDIPPVFYEVFDISIELNEEMFLDRENQSSNEVQNRKAV